MELSQDVNIIEERVNAFRDIDVSNWYEFGVVLLQCIIANILLQQILWKIKELFIWQSDDPQNDPSKMLKVNVLLVLVMTFKIFSFYYAIAGFLFSEMWKWDCLDNTPMTINPNIYVTSQILEAQALNITFIYCSKLWLKLWRLKLSMEQKPFWFTFSQYAKYLIWGLIFLIPIFTIISIFSIFQVFHAENFERITLGTLTLVSGIIFILICIVLYRKLKDFYNVGEKYTKTLQWLCICLIVCGSLRPFFNLIVLNYDWFLKFKVGVCEEKKLPDLGMPWAVFSLLYVPFTDFIPVFIISKLFSPNQQKRKTLVKISSGWDTGLE